MPLLNYTTEVNAQKMVTGVMGLLVAKGANEVSMVYDDNRQTAGLDTRGILTGSRLCGYAGQGPTLNYSSAR